MNRGNDIILTEALHWHEAEQADAIDWDGFTVWLEADPRHREAYDAVALGSSLIQEHRAELMPVAPAANDDDGSAPARPSALRGWWRWGGAAIAATLVALVAAPQLGSDPAQTWRTGSSSQAIALDDGSSVILAPHSELIVSGSKQQRMALNGGAWFDIRHDPARSLAITAGDVEIADIGTRFDVQAGHDAVRVEVAEGEVTVRSATLAQPIRLVQGRGLTYDRPAGSAIVRPLAPDSIGEWRSGRLSFEAAPLALVASDLARYAGVKVTVASELRDRQFSGTLVIDNGEAATRDLSQLMGIELRRSPAGLVLDERR